MFERKDIQTEKLSGRELENQFCLHSTQATYLNHKLYFKCFLILHIFNINISFDSFFLEESYKAA